MAEETATDLGSGSPARVAWDMCKFLRGGIAEAGSASAKIEAYLDLYAKCYEATTGGRAPKA